MMTNDEVIKELASGSKLNNARLKFYQWMARIEQAEAQLMKPSPFERRRMEFQAVKDIAAELGVTL